jgi:hypothetical protein
MENFRDNISRDPPTFFSNYTVFLNHYAQIAQVQKLRELVGLKLQANNVEMMSIGCELGGKTQYFDAYWVTMIAQVRAIYSGKLVYASLADEVNWISWWDKMDYIGVDAYYPLTDHVNPTVGYCLGCSTADW